MRTSESNRMKSLCLIFVVAAALWFVGNSLAGHGASKHSVASTITVVATRTAASSHALGYAGRRGDFAEVAWRISSRNGHQIGEMFQICRWVLSNQRFCLSELQMPLGKIVASGTSTTSYGGEYAVTGGTGAYINAGGVMNFTAIGLKKIILSIALTQ